jgi:hypothetical protein
MTAQIITHFDYLPLYTTVLINMYSRYSYRKREIEQLIRLTDFLTWEQLPTRDPDTGHLTKAGYIPLIQRLARYVPAFLIGYHSIQSTVRMIFSHDMVFFTTWYPFDASVSPAYEIANFTQVMLKVLRLLNFNLSTFCTTQNVPRRLRSQLYKMLRCYW